MSMFARASLVWTLFLVIAFANGAIREIILQRFLGINSHLAHQLSCFTGILFLTIANLLIWSWLDIRDLKQSLLIGFTWFLATALFETFILNRKLSTDEILQTYNFAKGELWGFVLIWIGVMPTVIFTLRKFWMSTK